MEDKNTCTRAVKQVVNLDISDVKDLSEEQIKAISGNVSHTITIGKDSDWDWHKQAKSLLNSLESLPRFNQKRSDLMRFIQESDSKEFAKVAGFEFSALDTRVQSSLRVMIVSLLNDSPNKG
ncbi:hypothetical protein MEG05_15770 [Vibrio aestuarianus]|uniref:hypothetical protein n=1 Tax=Vibrio aestuarianus TaxID=28171 RepID=UPI00237C9464|nr:hypothetical protein [Vibrio aestuarianus]MDE1315516.1 hypothetical protein [Vibrio aestuarianus]